MADQVDTRFFFHVPAPYSATFFEEKIQNREEKRNKGKKRGGKKEGNSSKKEGKYPYFVSLFNIGPYDR